MSDRNDNTQILRATEVAGRLGIGKSTVYALAERGVLPAIRIGGAVRFRSDVIESFIERGGDPQAHGRER